jgi:hypothetical protein
MKNIATACALFGLFLSPLHAQVVTTLTPESVGAVCDDATDNTVAFRSLATAINSAKSAVVNMAPNCVYRFMPSPTTQASPAYGENYLMEIAGVKSLTVNCYGSTLATPFAGFGNTATNAIIYTWSFRQSSNLTFNDCKFDQPNYRQRGTPLSGSVAFLFFDGNRNVTINHATVTGGKAGFLCFREPNADRSSGFSINIQTTEVYYPVAGVKCPDNLFVSAETKHPGRSYFVYNVDNHLAFIRSDASDELQDVIVSNAFDDREPYEANITSNITVNYVNRPSTMVGAGVDSFMAIDFQTSHGTGGQGIIDGVTFNASVIRTDGRGGRLLLIMKDPVTPAARVLSRFTITGSYLVTVPPSGNEVMSLMSGQDWTGEQVVGITIKDFWCYVNNATNPSVRVDGRGIAGTFSIENVHGGGICGFAPTNMTGVKANYRNAYLPTLITP